MNIPQNLVTLHQHEERLRSEALNLLKSSTDLTFHLDLTERAMDLLNFFVLQQVEEADDGRAIQHLAIRAFNAFASVWKLTASGYHQVAAMILRDLVETIYLVNHFHDEPTRIAEWRCADRKQLRTQFGPAAIRKALDARAGRIKSRREEIYVKFSNLAGHPTREGFELLRPEGSTAVIGPFMNDRLLKALLEEQGQLALQAGFAFGQFVRATTDSANAVLHRFLAGAFEYSERFVGKTYSDRDREEIDRLFGRSEPA